MLSQRDMFEQSFKRPSNYFKLSTETQWKIDKSLGILDWEGDNLDENDKKRFYNHYGLPYKSNNAKCTNFTINSGNSDANCFRKRSSYSKKLVLKDNSICNTCVYINK